MKLIACHIENFGKLSNYDLVFDEKITVINEANGFGKTTLAAFIKAMFYGMPRSVKSLEKNDRKRYMPWQGGRFGGNLSFEHEGKKYRIERFFGNTPKQDRFVLFELDPLKESEDFSEDIGFDLFRLDADSYEKSTYMPQNYDQGSFSTDIISAKLNDLAEEAADISHFEGAVNLLKDKRSKLMPYRGNGGTINEARQRIRILEEEILKGDDIRNKIGETEEKIERLSENEQKNRSKIETVRIKISKASEAGLIKAAENRCKELQDEKNEIIGKLEEIRGQYHNGFPETEEIEEISGIFDRIIKLEGLFEAASVQEEESTEIKEQKNSSLHIILLIAGMPFLLAGVFLLYYKLNILGAISFAVGAIAVLAGNYLNFKNMAKKFDVNRDAKERTSALHTIKRSEYKQKIDEQKQIVENFAYQYDLQKIPKNRSDLNVLLDDIRTEKQLCQELEKKEEQIKRFSAENAALLNGSKMDATEDINILKAEEIRLNHEKDEISDALSEQKYLLSGFGQDMESIPAKEDALAEWKLKLEEDKNSLNIVEETIFYLTKAKEKLDNDYIAPLKEGFDHYLKLILKEENMNVFINKDLELMPEQAGEARALTYFSQGYADMISICMRFALVDALFSNAKPFVILDDPFVNLDDAHTKEALSLLRRLSEEKQIIYLVCHSSRC